MDKTPFKMFGLQRTCTNITLKLVENNFQVVSTEKGTEWKHGPVKQVFSRKKGGIPIRMIFMVKDPYAWAWSCFKYLKRSIGKDNTNCRLFKKNWSFQKFIECQHYHWTSPACRWSAMNRHYLSTRDNAKDRSIVIPAEGVYGEGAQKLVVKRLEEELGLPRKASDTWTCSKRLGISNITDKQIDLSHFTEERYMDQFTEQMLQRFNKGLDPLLMKELGYEFVGHRR